MRLLGIKTLLIIGLAFGGVNQALAAKLDTGFILASLQQPHTLDNEPDSAQLFGVSAQKYADTTPFTKWHGVLARFDYEFKRGINTYQGQAWAKFLAKLSKEDTYTKARAVNAYFNRIKFRDDTQNWAQKDMWATPFEFMQRGGDCEDYAIAKYISLRALGVAEKNLHLTVVFDRQMQLPHAILVLRDGDENWILDNQTKQLAPAALLKTRYQPVFGLNQNAWWHYKA